MKGRHPFPIMGLVLWAAASSPAAGSAAPGPGTSVAPAFKLGPGARPAGLGGAFVAVADDAEASGWNPAGLAVVPRKTAGFMHYALFQGINYEQLSYAHPVGQGAGLGAHVMYVYTDAIPKTFEDGGGNFDAARSGGSFSDSDLKANLSAAFSPLEWAHIGVGANYFQDRVDVNSAAGFMGDCGALLTPHPNFSLGASLQNVGPPARGGARPPSQLRGGAAFHWGERFLLAAELDHPFDSERSVFSAGSEYWYQNAFALRAGFRWGNALDQSANRVSAGFGVRLGMFRFDYAFSPVGDLGDTHRFGLSFFFGESRASASVPPEPPRQAAAAPAGYSPAGTAEAERAAAPEPPPPVREPTPAAFAPEEPSRGEPQGDAARYFKQATASMRDGRYDDAAAQLESAKAQLGERDQRLVRYYERLGRIAYLKKDWGGAKENYIKGLKLAQSLGFSDLAVADAYAGMGLTLMKENKLAYAEKYFQQSLAAEPSEWTRKLVEAKLEELKARR